MRAARGLQTARLCLPIAAMLASAGPALAQARRVPPRPPSPPRIEVGGGAGLLGGIDFGARDANLRANRVEDTPFRLFSTETQLASALLVEARLGYRVTPRLTAEARLTVARPSLESSLSNDVENAAAVEASTPLTEYLIEGGAAWRLSKDPRRRWAPFVSGGAGLSRAVYDEHALVENGIEGYVGGGALYGWGAPRPGVALPRAGLRLEARLQLLTGGVAEGAGLSPRGVISASVFFAF